MEQTKELAPYEGAIYDKAVKVNFVKLVGEEKYLKEVIFAVQTVRDSNALQKCAPNSLKNAIMNIALTGASLNPTLQQAYLIPRAGKCCLDFSYRGLCKIATDSGGVYDIDATVVHEKDVFDYEMGLEPYLKHKPSLDPDPGAPIYVYAVAILPPGNIKKFIVLNKKEIEKVKKTSQAKSGPWVDWEEEMWRKTAVKKLYKLLPQTERMSTAVAVLNAHEGLSKASKAAELEKRFGFNQESVEGELEQEETTCPNTNETAVKEQCEICKEKEGCPERQI